MAKEEKKKDVTEEVSKPNKPATDVTVTQSITRRVHCEACSKNYELAQGVAPVCCEKPTISNL